MFRTSACFINIEASHAASGTRSFDKIVDLRWCLKLTKKNVSTATSPKERPQIFTTTAHTHIGGSVKKIHAWQEMAPCISAGSPNGTLRDAMVYAWQKTHNNISVFFLQLTITAVAAAMRVQLAKGRARLDQNTQLPTPSDGVPPACERSISKYGHWVCRMLDVDG